MRVPHVINTNVQEVYQPSAQTLILLDEVNRKIRASNLLWTSSEIETLATQALKVIANNFEKYPIIDYLIPQDRDHLIEIIDTTLPLTITIPLIDDGRDVHYWKRCYHDRYGLIVRRKQFGQTWKSVYLERYIKQMLEEAEPQYGDEYEFNEILQLCAPYCNWLFISHLNHWQPKRTISKSEWPEVFPEDHISFVPIFKILTYITDFELSYKMENVGLGHDKHMFQLSLLDMQNLGKALNVLPNLKRFKLSNCNVNDLHMRELVRELMKNKTIVDLELSYLCIKDTGVKCIGNLMMYMDQLKTLNLRCNKINSEGAKGIAFALTSSPRCLLKRLDLSLNPCEYEGIMPICSALLRAPIPLELIISGCGFDPETAAKIGGILKYNTTLRLLDITNNDFGVVGGESVALALQDNKSLIHIDMRNTNIPMSIQEEIKQKIAQNIDLLLQRLKSFNMSSSLKFDTTSESVDSVIEMSGMDVISVNYSETESIIHKFSHSTHSKAGMM